jgi:hypothetical protein
MGIQAPLITAASSGDHYRKSRLCRGPETLGKGPQTLGNAFAESSTRQRADGKFFLDHDSLPRTLAPGSRHRLCRGPETLGKGPQTLGNAFAGSSTRQRADGKFFLDHYSLPSILALGSVGQKKVAVNRGLG